MADQQRRPQATADAFGQHTFTHTSTAGGVSHSVAVSSSTGGGGAPHWETSFSLGEGAKGGAYLSLLQLDLSAPFSLLLPIPWR